MKSKSKSYVAIDRMDNDYYYFETEAEAIEEAKSLIEKYRDDSSDEGWPEEMEEGVMVAKIILVSTMTNKQEKPTNPEELEDWGQDFDYVCDFELKKVEEVI